MKWVRARLDKEQTNKLQELRIKLKEMDLNHLSDNFCLRYLSGHDWDIENVLQHIARRIDYMTKYNLTRLNEEEFRDLVELKFFINPGSVDRCGTPVVFVLLRNLLPQDVSIDHLIRFMAYNMDKMSAGMQCESDQCVLVLDFHHFGYANWYKDHIKAIA